MLKLKVGDQIKEEEQRRQKNGLINDNWNI